MQNAFKHQANTLKTRMQQGNMKLQTKLIKFHKEHAQNGATGQHIHSKQDIATICPKQQLGIQQTSKQYATALQHDNKRHEHDVQVKHYKTRTLSYLQKSIEHAQKDMARLQIITVSDFAEITSGCNVQSYQTTCYRNLSWKTKAWHKSTKCIEQKSLTDHEPKRIRRYDGTHVNIASFVNRLQSMAVNRIMKASW